jgi:hypothetical protein
VLQIGTHVPAGALAGVCTRLPCAPLPTPALPCPALPCLALPSCPPRLPATNSHAPHLDSGLRLHGRAVLPMLYRFFDDPAPGAPSCLPSLSPAPPSPVCVSVCWRRVVFLGVMAASAHVGSFAFHVPVPCGRVLRVCCVCARLWGSQHHCRRCGFVFCVACSDAFLKLPNVRGAGRAAAACVPALGTPPAAMCALSRAPVSV